MPVSGTTASSAASTTNKIISSRMARGVTGKVSSVITVMSGRPSRQSRRLHQQHQHHQHEYHGVGRLGIKVFRQSLDHADSTPASAARPTPSPEVSVIIRGTLMPKARTSVGFSVAARRLAPSRVFSIRYQVAMHPTSGNTPTHPRNAG